MAHKQMAPVSRAAPIKLPIPIPTLAPFERLCGLISVVSIGVIVGEVVQEDEVCREGVEGADVVGVNAVEVAVMRMGVTIEDARIEVSVAADAKLDEITFPYIKQTLSVIFFVPSMSTCQL